MTQNQSKRSPLSKQMIGIKIALACFCLFPASLYHDEAGRATAWPSLLGQVPDVPSVRIKEFAVAALAPGKLTLVAIVDHKSMTGQMVSLVVAPREVRCVSDCGTINSNLFFTYLNQPNTSRPVPLATGETEFRWDIGVEGKGFSKFIVLVKSCGEGPDCRGVELVNDGSETGLIMFH